uniref:Major facilitator superfamily (MFS) profile domain-containing protein n=1 Tax=Photinus pyralis TaxID=7054 RepID=A0A1Y1NKT5_PHOPY
MLKGRPLQYFGTCIALLNMLGMGWPSPFLPVLERDPLTSITKDEGSWIATTYLIAGPVGSIIAGIALNKIGRKRSLLLSALPFLTSWIIIAITQRLGFLLLARFIAGIGGGAIYSVLPIYISELVDPPIRGFLISVMGTLTIVASLFINILGYYVNITYSSLICTLPSVVFLLFFPFIPETPNYYIVNGKIDVARKVLSQVRGRQIDAEEIQELVESNEKGLAKAGVLDLFKIASNRKGLFVCLGTMGAQQLAGIVPIIFYTQTIFEKAAADFPVIASTSLLYVLLIVFSAVSSAIVDRLGRRPLLITSISCCCVALLMEGVNLYLKSQGGLNSIGLSWMTLGDLSFLVIGYSIGLLVLPSVFLSELFPLNVKGLAVGFCNIYFSVVAAAVSKLFQITSDHYGLHVPFFVFSASSFLSLVFAVIVVPETKNKSLEQIQIDLRNKDEHNKGEQTHLLKKYCSEQ